MLYAYVVVLNRFECVGKLCCAQKNKRGKIERLINPKIMFFVFYAVGGHFLHLYFSIWHVSNFFM